ncbi:MAG: hypothetical protein GY778_23175 [bacterium]|nr:hypothetical protein [bacterium]
MTKRDAIDQIIRRNPSAKPEFLADFSDKDLRDYLDQLESLDERHPSQDPSREPEPVTTRR